MKSLAPNLVNWGGSPAYYVHLGRVYLSGFIVNPRGGGGPGWETAPAVTQTIMTGMPVAIRPAADTKVYLPIDPTATTDACNAALNLPVLWPSTVHPDGTWTLDEPIPASLNTPPPESEWYWQEGFKEPPEGEFPPPKTFPQYTVPFGVTLGLGNAQWTVAAEPDLPSLVSLATFLGVDWTDAAAEYAVHNDRVHLAGAVTANKDAPEEVIEGPMPPDTTGGLPGGHDYTTAQLAGALRLLRVSTFDLKLLQDSPIVPAGDTPPLVYTPTLSRRTLLGDGEGAGVATQARRVAEFGPVDLCPAEIWDPVTKSCNFVTLNECEVPIKYSVSVNLDVATVLAMVLPGPDWFLLKLEAAWQSGSPAAPPGCKIDAFGCGAGCAAGVLVPDWASTTAPPVYNVATGAENAYTGGGAARGLAGYLKPPASLYKGNPHIPGVLGSFLWRPSQLASFTVSGKPSGARFVDLFAQLHIEPYFEQRQVGAHAGETLDFSQTGWEALVSTVNPGTSLVGHVPT